MAHSDQPNPAPACNVTEETNPRTRDLDRLGSRDLLARILAEDAIVTNAVCRALPELTRACDALYDRLAAGGRWFNLGAGTSGRIGVLDAAEIPPTFGFDPARVRGLIAGGSAALSQAVEGAEDDAPAGRSDLVACDLGAGDAVVGLSASGRTPYVIGALEYAREVEAITVGVTCTPGSAVARCADIPVVAWVGPEAITGSTRMKGGLAQKMILHSLSTAVMVRLGRVRGNQMVALQAMNEKLRERAVRILISAANVSADTARARLEAAGWSVSEALAELEGQGG